MTPIGAQIGEGFIAKQDDGEISGDARYFEFPIILRLTPGERDGKLGYAVAIHIAPLEPRKVAG